MNKRMGNNFIINIGRQLGSGGREIGEKLAARLGIDFYDKELIRLASEESGLCCEFFEKADEKASRSEMEYIRQIRLMRSSLEQEMKTLTQRGCSRRM